MDRVEMIRQRLSVHLDPESVEIEDQSHLHAGHAGAASGGGHFEVVVVAQNFSGLNMLARHRLVYDALGEAMRNEIHALSIKAYTPDEL
ncbi:MAG TPA: BolA family transcriptional regulator [Gammaproteobacteria bacterium]|nr:BolA family transcriptional regulator [Acidiferrobacteraceae bacterium]HCF74498.1 BolA family transcriptional regulator [Gammaproteobacteria bacterium]